MKSCSIDAERQTLPYHLAGQCWDMSGYYPCIWPNYFTKLDFSEVRGPISLPQLHFGGPGRVRSRANLTRCMANVQCPWWVIQSYLTITSCANHVCAGAHVETRPGTAVTAVKEQPICIISVGILTKFSKVRTLVY